MRPQKIDDTQLIEGLMSVLQSKGFEGASLNDFAQATGLQKASLYHRFPGGKNEMAIMILQFVNTWIKDHIYLVLTEKGATTATKLQRVVQHIKQLYQNGEKSCILNALSLDSGLVILGDEISKAMRLWMEAFTALGVELGYTTTQAETKARQSLTFVQGGLVLAKGLGDPIYFHKALSDLKSLFVRE
ncbi:TetR/AcrR family transcriptional regulator [Chitinophaga nivalis]|uniref:TetR/AcrR family transcriptional regulator n=1 Tax=Chitinophaga nivalis TaxID=2991709 RepID=A0ABT3IPQ5_9BACT|nr:TetR/AcrR family transcriptional regulator [Chitinophaga nivalis]MCW3464382.1 TetR/AcrR family transcriptional regulator [Chitinophaga nivalis]MCW3485927.1 TetR/AcrR family transcriptional regulator [Chitinophaga nivalis]